MKLLPVLESAAFLLACVAALWFIVTRAALWWMGERKPQSRGRR